MGVCLRYFKMPLGWATAVFIVLVGWRDRRWSLHARSTWQRSCIARPKAPNPISTPPRKAATRDAIATISQARKAWDVLLLIYCLLAGMAPVWMILQPRGQLGGYFLYFALGAGAIGLILGGGTVQYPAFRGWEAVAAAARAADATALADAVHHDRLRRLLGLSFADRLGHDVEAAPQRNRRQSRRLRHDAHGRRWSPSSRSAA